jgi:hypothetical protein
LVRVEKRLRRVQSERSTRVLASIGVGFAAGYAYYMMQAKEMMAKERGWKLKEHSRLISKIPHRTVRYMILGGEW